MQQNAWLVYYASLMLMFGTAFFLAEDTWVLGAIGAAVASLLLTAARGYLSALETTHFLEKLDEHYTKAQVEALIAETRIKDTSDND